MFNIDTAIKIFESNSGLHYPGLKKVHKEIEKLFKVNGIGKLNVGPGNPLKIICGESTQTEGGYIYGIKWDKLKGNSFLPPPKNNKDEAEFHKWLGDHGVLIQDLNPLQLPSELYREGKVKIGIQHNEYINKMVDDSIKIIVDNSVTEVRLISRYKALTTQTDTFYKQLIGKLGTTVKVKYDSGESLSNDGRGGFFDRKKFTTFIT